MSSTVEVKAIDVIGWSITAVDNLMKDREHRIQETIDRYAIQLMEGWFFPPKTMDAARARALRNLEEDSFGFGWFFTKRANEDLIKCFRSYKRAAQALVQNYGEESVITMSVQDFGSMHQWQVYD